MKTKNPCEICLSIIDIIKKVETSKIMFLLLQVLSVSFFKLVSSDDVEFTILHNNDLHARFDEISVSLGMCTEALKNSSSCYGGFARTAHM